MAAGKDSNIDGADGLILANNDFFHFVLKRQRMIAPIRQLCCDGNRCHGYPLFTNSAGAMMPK